MAFEFQEPAWLDDDLRMVRGQVCRFVDVLISGLFAESRRSGICTEEEREAAQHLSNASSTEGSGRPLEPGSIDRNQLADVDHRRAGQSALSFSQPNVTRHRGQP